MAGCGFCLAGRDALVLAVCHASCMHSAPAVLSKQAKAGTMSLLWAWLAWDNNGHSPNTSI